MIDPKARRILFDAYWSAKGWKHPRDEPSSADVAYAKCLSVMFDKEWLTHDRAVARILAAQHLSSTRAERDELIEGLVTCGVLASCRTRGADRRRIPVKSQFGDLAALWRGADGVNREKATALFGWGAGPTR